LVLTHGQAHKLSLMFNLSLKLFREKIRVKTRVRALSKSFLRNLMAKGVSNAKGTVTFKLNVPIQEHLPLEKLKRSTRFTRKQVRQRKNLRNKILSYLQT